MGAASDAHVEQWQRDGWVLIPGLVPADEIDAALDDLWRVVPRPSEYHAAGGVGAASLGVGTEGSTAPSGVSRDGLAFRREQFLGRVYFPFPGSGALNRLAVHPNLVDFAERALQSTALRIYQMSVWAKYTGLTNYAQPLHQDQNHSVVPARMEPGWWHLEGFLYLSDVEDEGVAPTRAVPVGVSGAGRQELGTLSPDEAPELYAAEVPAVGPRGSFLAYRPDVFHRGVDLTEPGGARFVYNLSYKLAGHDWIGYENAQPQANTARFVRFVESCTPRQLALFGVPEPGHPYWTAATLDAMAARYPGLDLSPWRSAAADRAT